VLICENNGYAISVPTRLSQSTPDIADRAKGFGLPGVVVDGNDPLAVQRVTAEAIARARAGNGPTLIEAKTIRWERHSAFSSGKYDSPEEAQRWKKADPIPRFRNYLLGLGVQPHELAAEEDAARQIVGEAVKFALASPFPGSESLYEGTFAARDEV
jgi:TPP-dependent pyruvate/acetoin dehydrogenase alpha subunit